MFKFIPAACLLTAIAGGALPAADEDQAFKQLQGTWMSVSLNGADLSGRNLAVRIAPADKIDSKHPRLKAFGYSTRTQFAVLTALEKDKTKASLLIAVDPTQSPQAIDFWDDCDPSKDSKEWRTESTVGLDTCVARHVGIYKFEGDKLIVATHSAFTKLGEERRPTDFKAPRGIVDVDSLSRRVSVYQRASGIGSAPAQTAKKLDGKWTIVSVVFDGEKRPASGALIVEGNQYKVRDSAGNEVGILGGAGKLAYDASKSPAHIDLTHEFLGDDNTDPGIYELDGDNLKICYGSSRPKGFAADSGSLAWLLTLKSQK